MTDAKEGRPTTVAKEGRPATVAKEGTHDSSKRGTMVVNGRKELS